MSWLKPPSVSAEEPGRTGPTRIRILLADDHTLFRHGLRRLLQAEPGLEVVGEARDGTEAVRFCARLRPDVAVLDIGMPGLASFEAARQILRERPATRILFLSMYEDQDYVEQATRNGAAGYVLKDSPASELIAAIRAVHAGQHHLSPRLVERMLAPSSEAPRTVEALNTLTRREREVLKLLAEGWSVKAIAEHLKLSLKTVDSHKLNLMRKLGVHNKAQLVHTAVRGNVIKIR